MTRTFAPVWGFNSGVGGPTANGGAVVTSGQGTTFGAGDCASKIEVDVAGVHRHIAPK